MDDEFWNCLRSCIETSLNMGFEDEKRGYIVNFSLLTDIISDDARREIKKELVKIVHDEKAKEKLQAS